MTSNDDKGESDADLIVAAEWCMKKVLLDFLYSQVSILSSMPGSEVVLKRFLNTESHKSSKCHLIHNSTWN